MAKRPPLCVRLYFEPHLAELVRLVGYRGLPLPEARTRLAPLAQKYGKERMRAAANEVLEADPSSEPPLLRLKASTRNAAWQLLGPPPPETSSETRA